MAAAMSLIAFAPANATIPSGSTAIAGSGNLQVTANVQGSCTVGASSLPFGTYDPAATTDLTVNGSISLTCAAGAYQIGLDQGANAVGVSRNMTNGVDKLGYKLYKSAADQTAGTEWDDTSNYLSYTTADALTHSVTVIGVIPQAQTVGVGSYSDTVIVNVYL